MKALPASESLQGVRTARCPGCLSDQATVPVLYCKPSQGHIQLAK